MHGGGFHCRTEEPREGKVHSAKGGLVELERVQRGVGEVTSQTPGELGRQKESSKKATESGGEMPKLARPAPPPARPSPRSLPAPGAGAAEAEGALGA